MLQIDKRTGSKELIQERGGVYWLRGTHQPVVPAILPAGDIAFLGNGPDGEYIGVGIEYKKIGDLLSCMCDGRLSGHQLPLLQELYPAQYWLLVEGVWRGNPQSGLLETLWQNPYSHKPQWIEASVGSRKFTSMEFNSWLTTLLVCGGLRLIQSYDLDGTVQLIAAQYHWWTSKEFEEHRSHLRPDTSGTPTRLLRKPKTQKERSKLLAERIAAQFDGIGWEKAAKLALKFGTGRKLISATHEDWMAVDGLGKTLTDRAFKDLEGE